MAVRKMHIVRLVSKTLAFVSSTGHTLSTRTAGEAGGWRARGGGASSPFFFLWVDESRMDDAPGVNERSADLNPASFSQQRQEALSRSWKASSRSLRLTPELSSKVSAKASEVENEEVEVAAETAADATEEAAETQEEASSAPPAANTAAQIIVPVAVVALAVAGALVVWGLRRKKAASREIRSV